MSQKVVLAGAVRTAIGKFGGALAGIPAVELGALVIREALERSGVPANKVDEVFMGCVLTAGLGQNVARQAAVKAWIPDSVPALTINNVCGSGLKSVNMAAAMIAAGEADVIVAGGMENMSAAQYAVEKARFGYRMGDGRLKDTMLSDALEDAFKNYHMGITAENVAEKYGISREMQDEFALQSQQKCERAQAANIFDEEIVAVPVRQRKEMLLFCRDEYPRAGATLEGLEKLKPAFKEGGTVTAGNSSGINDGAAALVLLSERAAKELGVTPMATFVVGASAGVEPEIMGIGPVYSTNKALAIAGMDLKAIELIEANEAFAAQSLAVGKLLGWDASKVNVNGGAIALGHPVGASGCRILVSLLHEMRRRNAKNGLATLCVGGGMGVTTIVER